MSAEVRPECFKEAESNRSRAGGITIPKDTVIPLLLRTQPSDSKVTPALDANSAYLFIRT